MAKICVVEDEQTILEFIQLNLELDGHEVVGYNTGNKAFEDAIEIGKMDLLVLDNMLPGKNGIEICSKIREYSNIPILFLSAKGTTSERIEGLKAGANDYLPKPFDLEEFLLRTQILLPSQPEKSEVKIGRLNIDFSSMVARNERNELEHNFSKRELALLQLFVQNENRVISRDEILDKIWGEDSFPTSRTIDNFILIFRKLFEVDPKNPRFFHSIRGIGYKFTK